MDATRFFLVSDAALRGVIDRLEPADFDRPAPSEWTQRVEHPTLHDILAAHAYDEAWVPDVLAGKAAADGDPYLDADLLGHDPIAAYDRLNDAATAAVEAGVDPDAPLRFTYGDYPAGEGLAHMAFYRAFQAWHIARLVGRPIHLSDEVLDGVEEHVLPHAEMWRSYGVFPPAVEVPANADRETRILGIVGFWEP
jgi:hypothetical protein